MRCDTFLKFLDLDPMLIRLVSVEITKRDTMMKTRTHKAMIMRKVDAPKSDLFPGHSFKGVEEKAMGLT